MRKNNLIFKVLLIINIVFLDVYVLFASPKQESNIDILGTLEIAIIFVNFLFVVWVYYWDGKEAERRKQQEKKNYWYHDVLIQNNIKNVQKLFQTCVDVSEFTDEDMVKHSLRKIKDEKNEVENVFGYMLKAYDRNLYNCFNDELVRFEDEITNTFYCLCKDKITQYEYLIKVNEYEVDLISILMNYDLHCDA